MNPLQRIRVAWKKRYIARPLGLNHDLQRRGRRLRQTIRLACRLFLPGYEIPTRNLPPGSAFQWRCLTRRLRPPDREEIDLRRRSAQRVPSLKDTAIAILIEADRRRGARRETIHSWEIPFCVAIVSCSRTHRPEKRQAESSSAMTRKISDCNPWCALRKIFALLAQPSLRPALLFSKIPAMITFLYGRLPGFSCSAV